MKCEMKTQDKNTTSMIRNLWISDLLTVVIFIFHFAK